MRIHFASVIAKERSDCGNLNQQGKIAAVAPLLRNDNRNDNKQVAQNLKYFCKST